MGVTRRNLPPWGPEQVSGDRLAGVLLASRVGEH